MTDHLGMERSRSASGTALLLIAGGWVLSVPALVFQAWSVGWTLFGERTPLSGAELAHRSSLELGAAICALGLPLAGLIAVDDCPGG
jgi:hypothetical protein